MSGLFVLFAGGDILISIWVDKLFDGNSSDGLFQTAEQAIGHTLTIWFFLDLSFIKLGIGFSIATIVQNLRRTGRLSLSSYASAGLSEAQYELDRYEEKLWGKKENANTILFKFRLSESMRRLCAYARDFGEILLNIMTHAQLFEDNSD